MLRTALLAGFSLLIAAPASAQSALETASFIIFGSMADKGPDKAAYDGKTGFIKTGFGGDIAVVEQQEPCKFRVSGSEFYKNVRASIDYTVDFSGMRDDPQVLTRTETVSSYGPPSTLTHYLIHGVNICTKKGFRIRCCTTTLRTGRVLISLRRGASIIRRKRTGSSGRSAT